MQLASSSHAHAHSSQGMKLVCIPSSDMTQQKAIELPPWLVLM